MPDLSTKGPDHVIGVHRYAITHTPTGLKCEGGPFEQLCVMFYGGHNLTIDIRKNAQERDGTPTCVPGLVMLRDELTRIIDEYTKKECPTCHQKVCR